MKLFDKQIYGLILLAYSLSYTLFYWVYVQANAINITLLQILFLHLGYKQHTTYNSRPILLPVIIIFPTGPSTSSVNSLSSSLGFLSSNICKEAHSLIFHSVPSFDAQVSKVLQSGYAHLRQLTKIRSFLLSAD